MAVTIRDVAKASGVHVSTVSRTFSAPHLVNEDTRSRVLAIAAQLDYRPNRAARALTTGRTSNLGLIVADIANPFFPPLIKAAQAHARENDYHLFVADTDEDPHTEEELIRTFAKQVDGILLCSPRLSNDTIVTFASRLPFVVVNRQIKGISTVLMDIGQGTRLALRHLAELGHRHLALLGGPPGSWTSRRMRDAATAEATELDVELTVLGPNPPTERGGLSGAAEVAECGATGVLAYNDLMAIGLIEGLTEHTLRVPADISVVGVDNTPEGRLNRPKLTTVSMPTAAAGRAAVDLFLQHNAADGTGPVTQTTLATTLTVRESCGPPPATAPA